MPHTAWWVRILRRSCFEMSQLRLPRRSDRVGVGTATWSTLTRGVVQYSKADGLCHSFSLALNNEVSVPFSHISEFLFWFLQISKDSVSLYSMTSLSRRTRLRLSLSPPLRQRGACVRCTADSAHLAWMLLTLAHVIRRKQRAVVRFEIRFVRHCFFFFLCRTDARLRCCGLPPYSTVDYFYLHISYIILWMQIAADNSKAGETRARCRTARFDARTARDGGHMQ
jgi:hypothetical protein